MSLPYRWRNRIAVLALVVGVVLVVRASARQTTFYIDSANPKCTPGAGPGTQATPYCSMAYAATIANPGDTFLVSGPKHGNAPVTFTRPGTAANPITWRAVGTVAVGGFIDIDDAALVPTGIPNVWQIPWSATTGKTWQTHYTDIVVDDPNQTRFILKSSDGPLQLTPVLTEAEVAAHDGASFRDAANQRLLIHPYGDRIPSTANTDFVVGVGNSFQADTKANYQVFDGFTVTYTAGTSGTVTSNNNQYLNMHYVGNPLNVSGDNNYFENITINNGIFRGPPLWIWYTDGEGATGGFSAGSTGNTMKNLHVFNSWNATFNSEGATNNVIDGARFHGAPNHCTGTSNGNNIVRNAAWWNCQDFQWLFDPTGIVMEHVVIPGGGLAVSAAAGNTGPITIRNSIFTGTFHFVRGTGDAAGLPYEGCTWETGSLMEYNVISDLATIERCDTQIAYPIDEYVARCATGEFTGCMTIRNNIKIPVSTGGPDAWKKVMVDGMWRAMSDGKGGWIEETGENWNFRLVPGSVAINAGMVSGTLIDLFGMSRPQPVGGIYDIGAHEFSPGGDPAPTGKPIVAAPAAVTTTITAPTSSATYDAGTAATLTTLAGTSKSGRTITGCTWANSLGGSGNTSGTTSWTIPTVSLTVGSNVITVTCTNDGKTTGADIITVTRSSGGGLSWACEDTHASNGSVADVAAKVTTADDGDCVTLPGGTFTWASTLTLTGKSIQLVGAGAGTEAQCAVGGQTTYTCLSGTISPFVEWTTETSATGAPASYPVGGARITGITFESQSGTSGCSTYGSALVNVQGTSANFRFDHNTIVNRACGGILTDGYVRGVGDHNLFDHRASGSHIVISQHETWLGAGTAGNCSDSDHCGDSSWANPQTMGSAQTFVWEDNVYLDGTGGGGLPQAEAFVDDNHGGRVVHRFNTLTNGFYHQHGTESNGRARGLMQWEIYRNDLNWNYPQNQQTMIASRGGYGMFFDNVALSPTHNLTGVNSYQVQRADTDKNYYPWAACGVWTVTSITRSGTTATVTHTGPSYLLGTGASYIKITGATQSAYNVSKWGTRTGATTFTYQVAGTPTNESGANLRVQSPFDGNTGSGSDTGADAGYRCMDQVGAGPGRMITGYSDEFNPITDLSPTGNALLPAYSWNNTDDGALKQPDNQTPSVVVINRDHYQHNTAYNGTTQRGVGRGLRSARPTACTLNDAWWATNGGGNWNTSTTETYSATPGEDGGLDLCTATGTPGTWDDDWYVPYTYPHPLVSAAGPPPPPPAPDAYLVSMASRLWQRLMVTITGDRTYGSLIRR